MELNLSTNRLKKTLRGEVSKFYRNDRTLWKKPIIDTLNDLHDSGARAVFFGGTLRSLLLSRMQENRLGRPRDVDIVVSGTSIETLKGIYREHISRETRFGGLQLQRQGWQFDVWPLKTTWAFVHDSVSNPGFWDLPKTTFFNLEAIAVEVWPRRGKKRRIYSGNDQFFEGIRTKTLEINKEDNPFPELCVLRALVMAVNLRLKIGPELGRYITQHGKHIRASTLDKIYLEHYGPHRVDMRPYKMWIDWISDKHRKDDKKTIELPFYKPASYLSGVSNVSRVRVHALSLTDSSVNL